MPGTILIFAEHEHGLPKRTALEAVTKARELADILGGQAVAVALGAGAAGTAAKLGQYGADRVFVSESADFDSFLSEPHVEALATVIEQTQPLAVMLPDTLDGRDVGARLAARLDTGLVSAVVDLTAENDKLVAHETIFGGNYITTVDVRDSAIAIFLIRPNAFVPTENSRPGTISSFEFSASDSAKRARKGARAQGEEEPPSLEEASIIVSGGRGLGGPEPFALLADLAGALGGTVGASRAAVDAGWIPYAHQVGQTGRTVKPQLYFAIGISGAVQHRVGMQSADTIVAINRDAEAPIFQLADFGVVGDLFKIIPALTAEVRRRKGA